jgi:hypothetical protein
VCHVGAPTVLPRTSWEGGLGRRVPPGGLHRLYTSVGGTPQRPSSARLHQHATSIAHPSVQK